MSNVLNLSHNTCLQQIKVELTAGTAIRWDWLGMLEEAIQSSKGSLTVVICFLEPLTWGGDVHVNVAETFGADGFRTIDTRLFKSSERGQRLEKLCVEYLGGLWHDNRIVDVEVEDTSTFRRVACDSFPSLSHAGLVEFSFLNESS
jgi:hypothetical protein